MRKSNLQNRGKKRAAVDSRIVLFSLAFLLGVAGGFLACKGMGIDGEIKEYITQYAQLLASGGTITSVSLVCAVVAYYRVPCAVYLCGLFRHSFYLFCGIFLFEGFLLSFAVANFTLSMGRSGALVSLCLLGIRTVFILPIALSIALRQLSSAGIQRERRYAEQKTIEKINRRRYIILYPAILALGVMAELTFVPKLAAFALRQIS